MEPKSPGVQLRRGLRQLALCTAILFGLLMGTFGYFLYRANQNRTALCNFNDNLVGQITTSEKFLQDVNAGVREFPKGITRVDIETSLARQRATRRALSVLDCP